MLPVKPVLKRVRVRRIRWRTVVPAKMIPYNFARRAENAIRTRASEVLDEMRTRRSCRFFCDDPVPRDLIEKIIEIAHTAPSGANLKPWRFVAVDDPIL